MKMSRLFFALNIIFRRLVNIDIILYICIIKPRKLNKNNRYLTTKNPENNEKYPQGNSNPIGTKNYNQAQQNIA